MKFHGKKKAFSLIELSIVILIIALVIGGVLEGKKLIVESRLVTAQRLTTDSGIEKINDLVAWFETSLPESFDDISLEDNTPIAIWHDRAANNAQRHDAKQNNAENQPVFINHIINKTLPALQFSGDQFLRFSSDDLNNSSYAIFVVEQRNSGDSNLFFISGEGGNPNFSAGYSDSNSVGFNNAAANVNFDLAAYNQAEPLDRIHSFIFQNSSKINYFLNGGTTFDASNGTAGAVSAINEIIIGASFTGDIGNYSGYIAEVIIFKRNLLTQERQQIEDYLSRKYNIPIS